MNRSMLARIGFCGITLAVVLALRPTSAEAGMTLIPPPLTLANPEGSYDAVIDTQARVAYIAVSEVTGPIPSSHFGTEIVKVNLQTWAIMSPPLSFGGTNVVGGGAVIDAANHYAYFAGRSSVVDGNPVLIYKIDVSGPTMVLNNTLTLPLPPTGMRSLTSAVMDPTRMLAYFAGESCTDSNCVHAVPAAVVVNINPASNPQVIGQVHVIDNNPQGVDTSIGAGVIDTARQLIYYGSFDFNGNIGGRFFAVDVSGNNFAVLPSFLQLNPGEAPNYNAAVLDTAGNAYFGTNLQDEGSEVIQVYDNAGTLNMQRVTTLLGPEITAAAIDPWGGFAYFDAPFSANSVCVSGSCLGEVYQINVNVGQVGQIWDAINLGSSDLATSSEVIDPANELLYVGLSFGSQSNLNQIHLDGIAHQFLISINPVTEVANTGPFVLHIHATGAVNFDPINSVAYWDESPLSEAPGQPATVTDMWVTVPNSDIVTPGLYGVIVTNPDGHISNGAQFTVTSPPPSVNSFTATPPTIAAGGSSILSWSVQYATSVVIDNGVGTFTTVVNNANSGSFTVSPTVTTTYNLTGYGLGGTVSSSTVVTVERPNLSLTKTDSVNGQATLDQGFNYVISVQNIGDVATTQDVIVTDTIQNSSLVQLGTLPSGCSAGPGPASFNCNLGLINAGATGSVTIPVTPMGVGQVTNTVTAPADPAEANQAQHSDTINTTIAERADIGITKTDSVSQNAVLNTPFTYTIQVHNYGPSNVTNLAVTDNLPAGLTLNSLQAGTWSCSGATVGNPGPQTITCTLPSLTNGTDAPQIAINVTPTQSGSITNTASLTSDAVTPSPDPNPRPNSASDTVTVAYVDLGITKTDSVNGQAALGQNFNYTITVQNYGSAASGNVTVTDTILDAGVQLVSLPAGCSGANPGDNSPLTFTCNLGSIGAGVTAPALTIPVTPLGNPPAVVSVRNQAVIPADPAETNPVQHTHTETITTVIAERADLGITKTDNVSQKAVLNLPFTYTVQVQNYGPSNATNLVATDNLPAGLTLNSLQAGTWSCSGATVGNPGPQTIICTLPSLTSRSNAPGLVLGVTPTHPGSITNTASVTSDAIEPNPDPHPNNASDTVTVAYVDLGITKTDSVNGQAALGQNFNYTITVQNYGTMASGNVTVTDTILDAGVQLVSLPAGCSGANPGDNSPLTFTCTMGAIPATTTETPLTITVNAATIGSVRNQAAIPADPAETNPVQHVHTATITTQIVIFADLAITKTVSVASIYTGQSFSYALNVKNLGPSPVSGAVVTDNLPAEVTYASSTINSTDGVCSITGNAFSCTITRTLNTGDQVPITVYVIAAQTGTNVLNTATVTPPTGAVDPNPSNNSASASVNILEAPYLVKIVVTPAETIIGLKDVLPLQAQAYDQYNDNITSQVTFNWNSSNPAGSLSISGAQSTFQATLGFAGYQTFTVTAQSLNSHNQLIQGTAQITVINALNAVGNICAAHGYPVPWKPHLGTDVITFTQMAPASTLKIYSADERLVQQFQSIYGEDIAWDLKNSDGNNVASGVYFYIVTQSNGACPTKNGKVMVIR